MIFRAIAVASMALWTCAAHAESDAADADADTTRVAVCASMPDAAVISLLSPEQAKLVCRGMALLPDVRVKDIRLFSKAYVVLSHEGYDQAPEAVAKQLTQIVKLRGFNHMPDKWRESIDSVVRTYEAFNGIVTPIDIVAFLASAGPMATSLSDDGFRTMLAMIKIRKQGD